jgi:hypothetical protein
MTGKHDKMTLKERVEILEEKNQHGALPDFIEVDVVEFQDGEVPYTTIILNTHYIKQLQPIDNNHQSIFLKNQVVRKQARDEALEAIASGEKNIDIPVVSTVEELPHGGAVIYYLVPHGANYYTVTPYKEVRAKLLGIFDYE